jgi:hypothetical protein
VFERDIYKWWVSQNVSAYHVFEVDISRRTAIQVYPNAEGILWFGTQWTEDGKYVEIYDSDQVNAKKLLVIDPSNGVYPNKVQTFASGNILGVVNQLPFALEDREVLWAGCPNANVFFIGKHIEEHTWETRLWQGSQLIKTFQPMEFRFGLYESGFNDDPVGMIIEDSHFSPDCRYTTIRFGRDVWLLDTVEKSFFHVFTARQFLDEQFGGYFQYVSPSWAPNSHEFVFGDGTFGLEKYDVQLKTRSWLLAPGIAGGVTQWSKTGRWILASAGKGSAIISPAGDRIGMIAEDCDYIFTRAWSPVNDKIAIICHNSDTPCVEGKCPNERDYLVIWDLTNLHVH